MKNTFTRRSFVQSLFAGTAGFSLAQPLAWAMSPKPFAFVLLGDLHFDKLQHHDLEELGRTKPDDLRQVREYSSLTSTILPQLFHSVRETIVEQNRAAAQRVAFTAQVGDLVEGLCSSEALVARQDNEVVQWVRQAELGVPFLFTKGNHDITGPGAAAAFKTVFHPFLDEQRALLGVRDKLTSACHAFVQGDALFCFFDGYDKASLAWLESVLARRSARHCFVIVHQPVVPYGARSTWHLFSSEAEKPQRERLLELLGRHHVFVLTGHIHKYNLLVRTTRGGGRFLQLGLSSIIRSPEVRASNELSGSSSYNGDQVKVEPNFSPSTEQQRRAVYQIEAPFVKGFEYADLPGYALITVDGPKVAATVFPGVSRQAWRTLPLSDLLDS